MMAILSKQHMKWLVLMLVVSFGAASGCAHHHNHHGKSRSKHLAAVHASAPVPPPQVLVTIKGVKPHKNSVWVKGHWNWNGEKYVWQDGRWRTPSQGKIWMAGRWKHHSRGWVWVNGRWG